MKLRPKWIGKIIAKILRRLGFKISRIEIGNRTFKPNYDIQTLFQNNQEKLVILDVGAHDGTWCLNKLSLFPNSTFYCFEPQKEDFDKLEKFAQNYENVNVYNYGLSNLSGTHSFYLTKDSNSSSLLKPKGMYYDQQTLVEEIKIETKQLKQWMEEQNVDYINILKLDIQGHELNVLESSEEIIDKVDVVLIEVNFQQQYDGSATFYDILHFFQKRDFNFYNLEGLNRIDNRVVFSDAVFVNTKFFNNMVSQDLSKH